MEIWVLVLGDIGVDSSNSSDIFFTRFCVRCFLFVFLWLFNKVR